VIDLLSAMMVLTLALSAVALLVFRPASVSPGVVFSGGVLLQVLSGNANRLGFPIGPDRVLMAIAVAICLDRLVSGSAVLMLNFRHALLAFTSLNLVLSAVAAGTAFNSMGLFALLDRVGLLPFTAFVLAPVLYASEKSRRVLLAGLVILGAYLGITALLETTRAWSWVFPSYIADPSAGIHFGRARGPFLESAINGVVMVMCGVAAATALAIWTDRRARWLAALSGVLCLVGSFLTLTRAVWIAAAVAAVTMALLHRGARRFLLPGLVAVGAALMLTFALAPSVAEKARERSESNLPIYDRLNTNAAAIAAGNGNPAFGIGFDRFHLETDTYLWQQEGYPLTGSGLTVHNVFLARYAELGIIGTALWAATLLACVVLPCLRPVDADLEPWRKGLLAVVLAWVVVSMFGPTTAAMPNMLLWLWAGIVTVGSVRRIDHTDDGAAFVGRANA